MSPFTSPPDPQGFKLQAWSLVKQIPPGQVATYGQIAALIGPPPGIEADAYRAMGARWVGAAMAGCPPDVPWQRVLNAQGKSSLKPPADEQQRALLHQEGVPFDDRGRLDLKIYAWKGPGQTRP